MIFAIEFKRRMADASILGIIVDKLCYRKKLYLIILLKVDRSLEISFHYIILPLNLAICLWDKVIGQVDFNINLQSF